MVGHFPTTLLFAIVMASLNPKENGKVSAISLGFMLTFNLLSALIGVAYAYIIQPGKHIFTILHLSLLICYPWLMSLMQIQGSGLEVVIQLQMLVQVEIRVIKFHTSSGISCCKFY